MSRTGENIYKRKDGRWEGRFIKSRNTSGKAKYGYVYAKTYREVKIKLLKQKSDNNKIENKLNTASVSFKKMAIEWLEVKRIHVKVSTYNKYLNLLNLYILPIFGDLSLQDITHSFIQNQCNTLLLSGGNNKDGLSSKTVTDILSIIRGVLEYASQKGNAIVCDAKSIQIKHNNKELRVLSKNEQEKLNYYLLQNDNPYNMGILLCLYTGIRIGELCALHWHDVSLTEQTIYVHQTLQRIQLQDNTQFKTKILISSPKSSCSIRTIPIPTNLMNVLKKHSNLHGYFLTNSEDKVIEPRTMQNHFKKVLKECHIENINFHVLRHTFATRCIELGFDVKSLSEILGHASVNITMNRYVHPSMELKKENMQRLSSLIIVK